MPKKRLLVVAGASALGLILVAAAWYTLAPAAVGGTVTYAWVSGDSMSPSIDEGDLVVVRAAQSYDAGDVVAYRSPGIGLVIHRVVGRAGDRYLLQGDANSWVDSYRPAADELVGRLWLNVPSAGLMAQKAQSVELLSALALLLGAVVVTPFPGGSRRSRHGRAPSGNAPPPGPRGGSWGQLSVYGWPGAAVGALAAVGFVVGLAAFTYASAQPATQQVHPVVLGEHAATFRHGPAGNEIAPGLVDASVRPGQPLFIAQTHVARVDFGYAFQSRAGIPVEGTYELRTVLSHDDGWEAEFGRSPNRAFSDGRIHDWILLDTERMVREVEAREFATGVSQDSYDVRVIAEVVARSADPRFTLEEPASLSLDYVLRDRMIRVDEGIGATARRIGGGAFAVSAGTTATENVTREHRSGFAAFDMKTSMLRDAAVYMATAAAIALMWVAYFTWRLQRAGEHAMLRARYGDLIADSLLEQLPESRPFVAVRRFEELAAVARSLGTRVLHEGPTDLTEGHAYYVVTADAIYHYRNWVLGEPARMAA